MELPIKVQGVMYSGDKNAIQYLIIKRSISDGGFWQGMTGTLEEGETLKQCLSRELNEELGIRSAEEISDVKQVIQWSKKDGFIITEYVFLVKLDPSSQIVLSEEHEEYRWCDFDEAYNLLGKENNKNTLKALNDELEKKG